MTTEEQRARLATVGKSIQTLRRRLETLTEERQTLTAELRAAGVPLIECARLAKVTPEAIRIQERRRTTSSPTSPAGAPR